MMDYAQAQAVDPTPTALHVHAKAEAVVKAMQEGLVVSIECEKCSSGSLPVRQEMPTEIALYKQGACGRSMVSCEPWTSAAL